MKRLDWLKAEIKKTEDTLKAELNSNQACEVIRLIVNTFKFAHALGLCEKKYLKK